jgi:hypothetical protein
MMPVADVGLEIDDRVPEVEDDGSNGHAWILPGRVRVSGGFGLARVEAQLEQAAKALASFGALFAEIDLEAGPGPGQHLHGVVLEAPAVAALVTLGLAERPQPLHSVVTVGDASDRTEI